MPSAKASGLLASTTVPAHANMRRDPRLGDAVGQDDQNGDAEQPRQAAGDGKAHWTGSSGERGVGFVVSHPSRKDKNAARVGHPVVYLTWRPPVGAGGCPFR